jgi:hypothetical protein
MASRIASALRAAPRREEGQAALAPVAAEDAVHVEHDRGDHGDTGRVRDASAWLGSRLMASG